MFGASGMLWWGVGISVPILIHLFARQRYRRVPWAAMEFLLQAFRKTRRRIRLEQLLLLLLRILAIILFVLAMADPIIESASFMAGPDSRREVVMVIDTSYSMGFKRPDGATPFSRARDQALRLLRGLRQNRGDSVTLITAGKPARPLIKQGDDLDKVRAEIEGLEPGDGGTDYLGAFHTVAAVLEDLPVGAEVYLFSDLQKVGFVPPGEKAAGRKKADDEQEPQQVLASLVQQMRAKKATITIVAPKETPVDNLAVVAVERRSKAIVSGVSTSIVTSVTNHGARAQGGLLHFHVDGRTDAVAEHAIDSIGPGKTELVHFRYTFRTPGSHYLEVRFESDSLETDNRRALAVEVRESVQTLVVEGDPGTEPGSNEAFFFPIALDPGEGSRPSIFRVKVVEETRFDREDLGSVDLLVLMNVGLISRRRADEIQGFVEEGGGLLIYLGDRTQPATMNSLLFKGGKGVLPAEILDAVGELSRTEEVSYEITNPDLGHPALRWFDDPDLRILLSLPPVYRLFRTRPVTGDPDVRVLANFSRKRAALARPEPAIIEKVLGKGRTILITTSGDQDWNELPVFPTYLLLNKELAYYLTRRDARLENLTVGHAYQRVLKSFAREVVVSRDGEQLHVLKPLALENDRGYEIRTQPLDKAGVYRLSLAGQDPKKSRDPNPLYLAVNVDPVESDLTRVGRDYILASFGAQDISVVQEISGDEEGTGRRGNARLWWWLLLAGLIMLALETAVAQIFGLRSRGATA